MIRSPDAALAHLHDVPRRQGDASDLLYASVGIEKHRADGSHRGVSPHAVCKGLDPSGLHERVIVQKHDVVAMGKPGPDVVAFTEEPVDADLDQYEIAPATPGAQDGHVFGNGPVVDDDDFPDERAPRQLERIEALERRVGVVVVENDDRDVAVEVIRRCSQVRVRTNDRAQFAGRCFRSLERSRTGRVRRHEFEA